MNFKLYSSKYKDYALNCIHFFLFEFKTLCFGIQRKIFEIQRLIFGNLTIIFEILRWIFEIQSVVFKIQTVLNFFQIQILILGILNYSLKVKH